MAELDAEQMRALRGAYVDLIHVAMDYDRRIHSLEAEIESLRPKQRRAKAVADIAQAAFIALGGDPEEARNYWSWTYNLPKSDVK